MEVGADQSCAGQCARGCSSGGRSLVATPSGARLCRRPRAGRAGARPEAARPPSQGREVAEGAAALPTGRPTCCVSPSLRLSVEDARCRCRRPTYRAREHVLALRLPVVRRAARGEATWVAQVDWSAACGRLPHVVVAQSMLRRTQCRCSVCPLLFRAAGVYTWDTGGGLPITLLGRMALACFPAHPTSWRPWSVTSSGLARKVPPFGCAISSARSLVLGLSRALGMAARGLGACAKAPTPWKDRFASWALPSSATAGSRASGTKAWAAFHERRRL